MKKKLFMVALMAALSTIGYGFEYPNGDTMGNSTVGGKVENLNSLDKNFDSWEVRDKINGNINSIVEATDKNFNTVKDGITSLEGKLDGLKTDIVNAGMAADAANEGMLENKQDIADLNTRLEGYEGVKEEAHSAIILGQQNDQKINDLYANKVDNQKFEEHKEQQKAKDQDQDDKIQSNSDRIDSLQQDFAKYDGRLSGLEKRVDNLDEKMNKGFSLMAAMNAVDFQNVQAGEMALGAGIGHYGNAQSVALGVAYAPTDDFNLNAKYSVTAGDVDSFAVGAGATYKFKVGR